MKLTSLIIILYFGYLLLQGVPAFKAMLIRNKVPRSYRPMLLFWVTIFVFNAVRVFSGEPAANVLDSIQLLLEAVLICWQAKRWGVFEKRPSAYPALLISLGVAWVTGWILSDWNKQIPVASLYFAIVIIFLAIEFFKKQMNDYGPLLRNPVILFSIALFIYYFFSTLLDLFMLLGQYAGDDVLNFAYFFSLFLGIVTTIINIRSVLCISKHTTYYIA